MNQPVKTSETLTPRTLRAGPLLGSNTISLQRHHYRSRTSGFLRLIAVRNCTATRTFMRGYHFSLTLSQKSDSAATFVPSSLFEKLPAHSPGLVSRRNATFNPKNKDYRFGPVRVDWLDNTNMSFTGKEKARDHGAYSVSILPSCAS